VNSTWILSLSQFRLLCSHKITTFITLCHKYLKFLASSHGCENKNLRASGRFWSFYLKTEIWPGASGLQQ
jgi:hypothetical protein